MRRALLICIALWISGAAFALIWVAVRPAVTRVGLDAHSAAIGLAVSLGTAFTMTVLIGLQAQDASPQAAFRAAMVVAISAFIGMSTSLRASCAFSPAAASSVCVCPVAASGENASR